MKQEEELKEVSEPSTINFEAPLDSIPLPNDALDQDWKVNDGYISYSAELLRLSLLVMTAIATLCFKIGEHGGLGKTFYGFKFGLAFLSLSSASAVAHRYLAVDAMHYHIKALRLSIRKRPAAYQSDFGREKRSDTDRAKSERRMRDFRFGVSTWLLRSAATFLFLGVVFIAWHLTKL